MSVQSKFLTYYTPRSNIETVLCKLYCMLPQVKYYKGLGTSTSKEAKEYFSDMDRHRIPFHYEGPGDDDAILLVS